MLNETFGSLASIKSVDLILQLKTVFPKTYTDNQSVNENPIIKNKATEGDVQHRFHFLPFGQNESLVIINRLDELINKAAGDNSRRRLRSIVKL